MTKPIYIIKDIRHERREGRPSYVSKFGGTTACFEMWQAQTFTNKRDAQRAARHWATACAYLPNSQWVTVIRILESSTRGPLITQADIEAAEAARLRS